MAKEEDLPGFSMYAIQLFWLGKSPSPVIFQMKISKYPVIYTVLRKVTAPIPQCPAPVLINLVPSLKRATRWDVGEGGGIAIAHLHVSLGPLSL